MRALYERREHGDGSVTYGGFVAAFVVLSGLAVVAAIVVLIAISLFVGMAVLLGVLR